MAISVNEASEERLLDNSYELLSVLGRGANSVVYLAKPTAEKRSDLNLPELVTVKLYSDIDSSEEKVERLKKEALFLKSIHSNRVVKLFDHHCSPELSYLVLEHAPKGDVKSMMELSGKLDSGLALRFGIQLLDALTAVHSAGIIHGDVKPENLLITSAGSINLGDFGVSRFFDPNCAALTESGSVRGTLGYIAPEQLNGICESVSSDIFAAAVTIFEMLTNRLPYDETSMASLVDAMIAGRSLQLAELLGEDYWLLDTVLARGLSNDPDKRFHSALAFRRALEEVVWGLEVGRQAQNKKISRAIAGRKKPRGSKLSLKNGSSHALFSSVPRRKSIRFLPFVSLVVGAGLILAVKGNALANLRKAAPQKLTDSVEDILSKVFDIHSAFNQAKSLTTSARSGVLYNFLEDGQNVIFSTMPVYGGPAESGPASSGKSLERIENAFIFSLGLPGFKPQLVTLSGHTASREIHISGNGLRFSLQIDLNLHEHGAAFAGKLTDLSTGRSSKFAVF